jgi:uncharacterized protein YjbI with pentapeptide repeats
MGFLVSLVQPFRATISLSAGCYCTEMPTRNANLLNAKLKKARLMGSNLKEVYLDRAEIQEANLAGAQLQHANLREAQLKGANLDKANLTDAVLTRTRLQGTDLQKAEGLTQAQIDRHASVRPRGCR